MKDTYLKYGNGHSFEPKPIAYNHQCHWAPWAEHFRNHEGDIGILANMLGCALEEIDRLCRVGYKCDEAKAKLLFAYIKLVDTGEATNFEKGEYDSLAEAWRLIGVLNEWRRLNKLGIKEVDV